MKRLMIAAAFTVAVIVAPSWAQGPADHDAHHPAESASPTPAPANSPPAATKPDSNAPQGSTANVPTMGMINDMKNMMRSVSVMNTMGMMQTMGMMSPGMDGMTTIDRVEGRIAFLRTELNIADAQAGAWNAFADALRANAKKLAEVRASMMPKPGDAQPQAPTMADRLELQERWLLARLEGTRAIKAAFTKLSETLSDDQKKTADELLGPHMGMAIMPAPMRPGQMQPDQMGPGRMQNPSKGN
jgi:LTXXQ motif family protein